MLGTLDSTSKEVTIVGAGFAGLVAAYQLDRSGYRVELLEEAPQAGGLLGTARTAHGLVERAAHSFLLNEPLALLCRDLGVELVAARPEARARFVLRNGRLRRFPLSVGETATLLSRVAFRRARVEDCGMTLADWGLRHLGRAATENLLAPFLRGIFAAPPESLSLSAAFPQLAVRPRSTLLGTIIELRRERARRGERRARMHAPRDGMSGLVAALERRLVERLGERFRRNERVVELPSAPNLILAVPAYRAAVLLAETAPDLARKLMTVEYSPMVSATVFARAKQFRRKPRGVGMLAAPNEPGRILGLLFNSSAFEGRVREPAEVVSLTAMLGGASDIGALGLSDAAIEQEIRAELKRLFGFEGALESLQICRWPHAIPRYSRALEQTWALALEGWCAPRGRILFSNFTGQISLRGMAETASKLSARS